MLARLHLVVRDGAWCVVATNVSQKAQKARLDFFSLERLDTFAFREALGMCGGLLPTRVGRLQEPVDRLLAKLLAS